MSDNTSRKPILVVSTGRTGTGFLAHFIAEHFPQCCAHHIAPRSEWANVLSNAHLAGLLPRRAFVSASRQLLKPTLERCRAPFYVDCNNHLFALAPLAPELYSELRVVHVVRDPRTYVRSHMNWARHRRKSFIANHLLPFWQPNGYLVGEISARRWYRMSRFERFCWIWDYKNRLIARLGSSHVPYLRVRFEDLFESPRRSAEAIRVLAFIGLPELENEVLEAAFGEVRNQTHLRSLREWRKWAPARCAQLDAWCGDRMVEYGYGGEAEWVKMVREGREQGVGRRSIAWWRT